MARRLTSILSLPVLVLSILAAGRDTVYLIDPTQSRVTVTLKQDGLMSGRYPTHQVAVREFSGRVEIPSGNESRMRAGFEAVGSSFVNIDEKMSEFERREFHRVLRDLVLEIGRYPTIGFTSTGVSGLRREGAQRRFMLSGELRLHGEVRGVSFPVEAQFDGDWLTAEATTTLRQTDYKITPYTGALGAIKIGDEVVVTFKLVAKRARQ